MKKYVIIARHRRRSSDRGLDGLASVHGADHGGVPQRAFILLLALFFGGLFIGVRVMGRNADQLVDGEHCALRRRMRSEGFRRGVA